MEIIAFKAALDHHEAHEDHEALQKEKLKLLLVGLCDLRG
jgi:hypothetical protein